MPVAVTTIKASQLPEIIRQEMGLAPDAVVEIRPQDSENKKTEQEIKRMQELVDRITPAKGGDNTDSVTILRSLRDGREGRASSTDDDNQ